MKCCKSDQFTLQEELKEQIEIQNNLAEELNVLEDKLSNSKSEYKKLNEKLKEENSTNTNILLYDRLKKELAVVQLLSSFDKERIEELVVQIEAEEPSKEEFEQMMEENGYEAIYDYVMTTSGATDSTNEKLALKDKQKQAEEQ